MGVNHTWYWSAQDIELLVRLARERVPTRMIATRLGRSEKAVRNKASQLQLGLSAFATRRALQRLDARGAVKEGSRYSRRAIRVTVDFDISALSTEERLTLAARLLDLPGDSLRVPELPAPYDAVAAARARRAAQLEAQRAEWEANGGKRRARAKRSREERVARREARRNQGLKEWMLREKHAGYLNTWLRRKHARDVMG